MTAPKPEPKLKGTLRMVTDPELVYKLFGDGRVSIMLKLLPVAAVAYLFWADPIPCIADDALIIWFLSWLFIKWSPKDVVRELRGLPPLQPKPKTPQEPPVIRVNTRTAASESISPDDDNVVDGEYWDWKPKK